MTRRQWSLVAIMILINYLIFSQLFNRIMKTTPGIAVATPTIGATFTPTPTATPLPPTPTFTPIPIDPTVTNTPVIMTEEQRQAMFATQTAQAAPPTEAVPSAEATATPPPPPVDTRPRVTAAEGAVNLRSGPGVNYPKAGSLPQGQSLDIVGRNADSSWWQVAAVNGLAWISAGVTTASNVDNSIPVVEAPPPPATATPVPATATPPPPQPSAQFTIKNIFGQTNEAITQVRGEIRDTAGNPVDGVRVRVRAGSFCTVSVPTGQPGVYSNGVYDVLLDNKAKPGEWQVAIVNGPADPNDHQCNDGLAVLSEEVTVPTNSTEGVVFVEWVKNF